MAETTFWRGSKAMSGNGARECEIVWLLHVAEWEVIDIAHFGPPPIFLMSDD